MNMAEETVNMMNDAIASQGSDIDESQRQIKRLLEENLEIWKANLKEWSIVNVCNNKFS